MKNILIIAVIFLTSCTSRHLTKNNYEGVNYPWFRNYVSGDSVYYNYGPDSGKVVSIKSLNLKTAVLTFKSDTAYIQYPQ